MKYSLGDTDLIGRGIRNIFARNAIQAHQVGISSIFPNRKVLKDVVLNKYKIGFVCS